MLTQAPKGTRDVLVTDSYKWQYIEEKIRRIAEKYCFREIRTPVIEHTELFLRGVGDTTDIVQKEMYTFFDKGQRSITLKPEGTAGAVRAFIEHSLYGGPQPTKMYYLNAPVFRYEKPQSGRLREHHQFGIEVFGAQKPSEDAEVISLAYSVLESLGVNSLALHINSIGCKSCRPAYNSRLVEYLAGNRDKLCRDCQERLIKNPLRVLDCKEESCKRITENAPRTIDCLCDECAEHFDGLKSMLNALGIAYTVDPHIVRGLDYYTKTVFEIISTDIGAQGTVCGGGRYDGLVSELGGPELPAVGFGMGLERLLLVMDSLGVEIPCPPLIEAYICSHGDKADIAAFSLCAELRKAGVPADCDHTGRSFKAQFKYADKLKARYVIVIGDDELASGVYNLRDMTTGEEIKLAKERITEFFVNGGKN